MRKRTYRASPRYRRISAKADVTQNTDARPLIWTKLADGVMASTERFCLRSPN
jgi:hypothetical protein